MAMAKGRDPIDGCAGGPHISKKHLELGQIRGLLHPEQTPYASINVTREGSCFYNSLAI